MNETWFQQEQRRKQDWRALALIELAILFTIVAVALVTRM